MIRVEVIQLKWEGPFRIEDLRSLNNYETDYGIYQIYGNHLVYGENVLLYIGYILDKQISRLFIRE